LFTKVNTPPPTRPQSAIWQGKGVKFLEEQHPAGNEMGRLSGWRCDHLKIGLDEV
jgi:hypothetical protein